ncbi:Ig-like domain-containing protein [Butyrivibrio sp. AE3004]|uniref:Ig-like domain-containing protein n=1 Tax=Butyrivibrio sp. AE3004 TaxID=1506994 RepID=UPI00068BC66F|nr:Ig-like domain-containing protein [Butyrivibrio sp. AE3004]
MKKVILGKSGLALLLSCAIVAESNISLTASAAEITEPVIQEIDDQTDDEVIKLNENADVNNLEDLNPVLFTEQAVSDGNAETSSDINESSDSKNDNEEIPEDVNASEYEQASENGHNDEGLQTPRAEQGTEDAEDNGDLESNKSDEAVTDGNIKNAVSDGNAAEISETFDYETYVDGYKIKLHAFAGVIPDNTDVSVKKVVSVDGKKTDDLVNEVLPSESVVFDSASFDITLLNDGQEIEPNGPVQVEITLSDELAEANSENESTSVQVFHIEDDTTTTEVRAEVNGIDSQDNSEAPSIGESDYSLNVYNDNATDIYDDSDETVVRYEADSFSVYDVSVVLNFTTSDPYAAINPVYDGIINLGEDELQALGEGLDSTVHVKTLLSSGGKCTSVQEMGEAARRGIMARQTPVTIDFKLPGIYNQTSILNALLPIMYEHTGVPNEGDYVRWAFCGISQKTTVAYANDSSYGTVQLAFKYTHNAQQEVDTTNAINALVKNLNLQGLSSDYDKARKAYDWICTNVTYDYDYKNKEAIGDYSPYSCYTAVVKHSTVCEGYSLLFYRMMLMSGVDARLISGDGGQEGEAGPHGWNIVKIGNIYYNLDSTWGSEFGNNRYIWFLRGSKNFDTTVLTNGSITLKFVHTRYAECSTPEFNRIYPTSVTDYNNANYNSAAVTISLNASNMTLGVGASTTLQATVSPASGQGVIWSSSDDNVAAVNSNGTVTGLKCGECEIFATTVFGGKKARCRVLVTDGKVKNVEVASSTITIFAGSKANVNATVFPEWASNKGIKYKSSNKSIATVNKKGIITARKKGKCYITCTSKDGGLQTKVTVIVKKSVRVKSIKLNKKKLKLAVGSAYTLGVNFKPKKATNKEVTWKSSKPGIVSVDANGNIYALSKGKAKITAKSVDGKHKATCTVVVK